MAEVSYLWTTNAVGDGTGTGYTQVDASNIFEIDAQCFGRNGIAPNYLNSLAPSTTGANNARIATGGALVDGKPYMNSANVDFTIPSAVGGGNTRIDRIVLRASWSAQTVRLTRIAGTDAASPTAPAITQTPGTTYDVLLCQALVNTSGTVTITDERSLAQVDTTEIANLAVTLAKLAADSVDDTKAGSRVPQFYRRQGGDTSNWDTAGTTTYTPTSVRMQAGRLDASGGGTSGAVNLTFPTAFSNGPVLLLTPVFSQGTIRLAMSSVSASGASFNWYSSASESAGDPVRFAWLAVGPE